MNPIWIAMIVILVILLIAVIVLYILGKRSEKKRAEQQAQIDAYAQTVSMLVIDKKMMKIKQAGLPDMVLKEVPWYAKLSKVPIVKAKVGPKIMTLIADADVFKEIPVKREVKATVSGIYITGFKGIRGNVAAEPEKKGFFARFRKNAK